MVIVPAVSFSRQLLQTIYRTVRAHHTDLEKSVKVINIPDNLGISCVSKERAAFTPSVSLC